MANLVSELRALLASRQTAFEQMQQEIEQLQRFISIAEQGGEQAATQTALNFRVGQGWTRRGTGEGAITDNRCRNI
jgi:hypothetical protein